jgi:SAM-dependent methyltransferase
VQSTRNQPDHLKSRAARLCPICGSGAADVLHIQRFVLPEGHPLSDGYPVVCCGQCGFVYADTAARQEDYDIFYAQSSKYRDNGTSTGGGGTELDSLRLRETAADIARLLPDRAARIIDVGCANGGLLAALKKLGFDNLYGIDPSAACAAHVRSAHGIDAQVGSLSELPAGTEPADLVILSHVLEHVRELRAGLAALRMLLKASSLLYVEVPDASRYAEFVFAPFQDFNTEHINHFSPSSLENLLRAAGLQVKAAGQRLLASAPGMPYPAIFAVARQPHSEAASLDNLRFSPDASLRPAIEEYIRLSAVLLKSIDGKIRLALERSGPILVWGTGQLAMKLLAETCLGSARIAAFVDGNPIHHGESIRGVPVLAPEEIRAMPEPIMITTTLHEREIAAKIREMGMTNGLILLGDALNSGTT